MGTQLQEQSGKTSLAARSSSSAVFAELSDPLKESDAKRKFIAHLYFPAVAPRIRRRASTIAAPNKIDIGII
jgi:hypothetical protein